MHDRNARLATHARNNAHNKAHTHREARTRTHARSRTRAHAIGALAGAFTHSSLPRALFSCTSSSLRATPEVTRECSAPVQLSQG